MLIFLVQLGKLLERRAKDRIQDDLGHYYTLMPTKVRICSGTDTRGRYVAAAQLAPGELFQVTDGEILAADGLVIEGQGMVDASSLTGEARPQPRVVGDRLVSGTRVIEGTFVVRAENVGAASTLGQMLAIMDAALSRKTIVEGRTDRILRLFVPVMIVLAVLTTIVLLLQGITFEQAFIRGLTVLVISCPCALGVAVPLARVAGVSLAARRGILVQDFTAFDMAERVDTVVFDKTGTLTQGRWQLQSVEPLATLEEREILALAAGMEHGVDHPVAVEIQRAARARQIEILPVTAITPHARGVAGLWQGRPVRLGSADFAGATRSVRENPEANPVMDDSAVVSRIWGPHETRRVSGGSVFACQGVGPSDHFRRQSGHNEPGGCPVGNKKRDGGPATCRKGARHRRAAPLRSLRGHGRGWRQRRPGAGFRRSERGGFCRPAVG